MDAMQDFIEMEARRFESRILEGDIEAIAAMYAPDARLLEPDHPEYVGRREIAGYWEGAKRNGLQEIVIKPQILEEIGDVLIETGRFYALVAMPGQSRSLSGKFMLVWRRVGIGWQIYRHMSNGAPSSTDGA